MNYYVIHWYSKWTGKGGSYEPVQFASIAAARKACEALDQQNPGIDHWPVPVRTNKQASKQQPGR